MKSASIRNRVKQAVAHDEPEEIESSPPDLKLSLAEHRDRFEIDSLRQKQRETEDLHDLRVDYTGNIFKLVCVWLACVIVCVTLSGFKLLGFSLSDAVLVAFITSTTINVVGLFIVVAKWMYPAVHSAGKVDAYGSPEATR